MPTLPQLKFTGAVVEARLGSRGTAAPSASSRGSKPSSPTAALTPRAAYTEIWEQYNYDQLDCAGASVSRTTIRSNGLYLPVYSNAARLTYVVEGECVHSEVIPGCPETYQAFQQPGQQYRGGAAGEQQQQGSRADEHQKVRRLKRGDIVATPPGFVQWFYNDGNTDLVLVTLLDTANSQNQLDNQDRAFFLAGNPQRAQEPREAEQKQGAEVNYNNIFSGFADEILQEVLGTSRETVERVKGRNDYRGHIILVRHGLEMIKPLSYQEEEQQRHQLTNGFEETICTARLRENMANPARADVYNPQAGYIRNVNRLNLPVLGYLYLSAERGVLYRNAIYAPHWNLYSHSIIYATRGSARVQIVGNQQRQSLFDGQLRQGQMIVVPQNFAVTAQAGSNGFEWISFKTGDNAISQSLAGKTSVFRGLPVDMLASMYQISRQEALKIKYNRGDELAIFPQGCRPQRAMIRNLRRDA
ncbi:hypothetical protein Scep_029711 [Stephania cephalantha]|uniref:Cupin type-1 domain-containing protein n=1 Tax=Stephania cephalantha TaxID=152367 RepID=A0AAP0E170_9MAGN